MSWTDTLLEALPWGTSHRGGPYPPDGGLALARNKPGLPALGEPISEVPLPEQLVLPLINYAKLTLEPTCQVGDRVKLGDSIAPGVIAPADGVISAIEPRALLHPSHHKAACVVIDVHAQGEHKQQALPALDTLDIERIERAGINGLGGAGFATSAKLQAAASAPAGIDTLIINAVECEPLISCDEALIRSDANSVALAIEAAISYSQCRNCIIAIEDDKTEALTELESSLQGLPESCFDKLQLVRLSAIYPSGAEKVLVQRLTGRRLVGTQKASDFGIVCLNVATVVAAWRAQRGYPMISRIVTIAGNAASKLTNVRVRFGTPVSHVLEHTGNACPTTTTRVRAGGPLSGFDLPDTAVPILSTTNCIAIEPSAPAIRSAECIRCNQCSDVCPVNLVPQQLFWYARRDDLAAASRFGLDDCIQCGCCDLVCPSFIELTSMFRHTKSAGQEQQRRNHEAELARERFEKREAREAQRQKDAQEKRNQRRKELASAKDPIAEALARSKARAAARRDSK